MEMNCKDIKSNGNDLYRLKITRLQRFQAYINDSDFIIKL
jgi:hypothetical protein